MISLNSVGSGQNVCDFFLDLEIFKPSTTISTRAVLKPIYSSFLVFIVFIFIFIIQRSGVLKLFLMLFIFFYDVNLFVIVKQLSVDFIKVVTVIFL